MSNILNRTAQALDHIAANPRGLTVTELAKETHTSKSTASRLLSSMMEAGMIERDDAQRHYLDVRFWRLGARSIRRLTVLDVARPHILAAVKELGVSVFVAVAREDKAIYLENMTLLGGHPFMTLVSYVVPIYACAPGKAILAHSDAKAIRAVLDRPLEKFTPTTLATKSELAEELLRIRNLGYALNRSEYAENGRIAVAVPIFDSTSAPVASICFHGMTEEERVKAVVPSLLDLGRTISSSLGYAPAVHDLVG